MTRAWAWWRGGALALAGVVGAAASNGCTKSSPAGGGPQASVSSATKPLERAEIVESVFDGGLKNGWQDWGWSKRDVAGPGPAQVHFGDWGGWIVAKPGLKGDFGAFVFRVKEPEGEGEFLEVRVESAAQTTFPRIKVGAEHRTDVGGGWFEVAIPLLALDPDGAPYDRVVLRAFRAVADDVTLLDKIGFTKSDPNAAAARLSATSYGASSSRPASLKIACDANATKISPLIYGFAYYFQGDDEGAQQWKMGATIRRWGGNTTSTYNWQIGAWNLGSDWFFENVKVKTAEQVMADDAAHGIQTALTVPMLGYVAKDTTSSSFPVSVLGAQQATDPYRTDAGNGLSKSGAKLTPPPPTQAGVDAPPAWVKAWVESIRAADEKRGTRSVSQYILDNEPAIWSTTHRDLHPAPLGYDELVQRTIDYGTAVRQADPGAVIAGPAEWGWLGYTFSGKDAAAGFSAKPDRLAHGDVPLIEWYLQKLREYEKKTGTRVLDVVDLHFYPQGDNVYGGGAGGTDAKTAALRLRSTRGLWDPTYTDESWIKDQIQLIPRMRAWIDKNYPGRGISIGEWNFGGEGHITGALATAEALGRFAQFGVTSAYYWARPPAGSPTIEGFHAYRDFDGAGGRFLDWYVPTKAADGVSLFASRDEAGKHLVAVAINMSPDTAVAASLDVRTCGTLARRRSFTYARGFKGFVAATPVDGAAPSFDQLLPPYSVTVIDVTLSTAMGGSVEK